MTAQGLVIQKNRFSGLVLFQSKKAEHVEADFVGRNLHSPPLADPSVITNAHFQKQTVLVVLKPQVRVFSLTHNRGREPCPPTTTVVGSQIVFGVTRDREQDLPRVRGDPALRPL